MVVLKNIECDRYCFVFFLIKKYCAVERVVIAGYSQVHSLHDFLVTSF